MLTPQMHAYTMSRAMTRNAMLDYSTPVMNRNWTRNLGPQNPLPEARAGEQNAPMVRQVDFAQDSMVRARRNAPQSQATLQPAAMSEYDPALGNRVDLFA